MDLFSDIEEKKLLANHAFSGGKWTAIKNNSWGAEHVTQYGNRAGYVICYKNRNNEFVALCSVIGQPFVNQTEIDANARIIELAPEMAAIIKSISILNEEHYKDIAGFILASRELCNRFKLSDE
jgi:hypothetical protein